MPSNYIDLLVFASEIAQTHSVFSSVSYKSLYEWHVEILYSMNCDWEKENAIAHLFGVTLPSHCSQALLPRHYVAVVASCTHISS